MIVIVDYGMGNLRSVSKALEHLGATVRISSRASDLDKATKIILPGVGAFGDAVHELRKAGLYDKLVEYLGQDRPFLGICLGLQLLFTESQESPGVKGLDIFPGTVTLFRSEHVKVPHMGWNQLKIERNGGLLDGIPDGSYFYFVHSFYVPCLDKAWIAASCEYGEESFCAVLNRGNIWATQFHPEKSQDGGLRILQNFVAWQP